MVDPVNHDRVVTGVRSARGTEASSVSNRASDLGYSDPDDNDAGVTFTVANQVNGKIQVNNVDATSFTGTQLTAGLVTFLHNGSETLTAKFDVSVEDGNEDASAPVAQTFNLTVNPVNDAPVAGADQIYVSD